MHRIDGPGHLNNLWTDGNPATGVVPTEFTAAHANALQEEIATFIESQGIALNKADNTQLAAAIATAVTAPTSQTVDNGWFNFWQRIGTPFLGSKHSLTTAASPALLADRWIFDAGSGTAVAEVWKETQASFGAPFWTFENGTPKLWYPKTADTSIRVALGWDQTAATDGTRAPSLIQKLDLGAGLFAQKKVTVSFVARTTSGTTTIKPTLTQWFGSSGSTRINYVGTEETITTTLTRYSQTFDLGSVDSKTVIHGGIDVGDFVQIKLELENSATFTIEELFDVRVERGAVAVPALMRHPIDDLRHCRRFYEGTWALGDAVGDNNEGMLSGYLLFKSPAAQGLYLEEKFREPKHRLPTVVFYDDDGTADRVNKDDLATTETVTSIQERTFDNTGHPLMTAAGDDAAHNFWAHWSADSEFDTVDRSA